ncbi:hypothetical protein P5G51_013655 [Virgibacillus sp. 179-BFC.A HS]|uniref:DUF58 domain-containing protein n=1 Tax=Tigheibacillus jepli TaxID=3035914 RepID=A0ABU5CIW9_9BACI|nr:hypothetical protein [Virgibacillus sp. 179-BFC.A HS]MDY0406296.1 hypothetical protein [Virgibacillus sp. 179-BFC.A HS]
MSYERLRNYDLFFGLSFFCGVGIIIFLLVKGAFLYAFLSFILLFIFGIIAAGKYTKLQNRLNESMKARIASLQPSAKDFQSTIVFIPDSLTVKLVFDVPAKRLYIWRPVSTRTEMSMDMPFNIFNYAFDEISEVKVIANDQTIASSKDFSDNEAGSIAKKIQFKRLKTLLLEIRLNDICHTLPFYKSISGNGNIPVRPITPAYKQNVRQVQECFTLLNKVAHGKSLRFPNMDSIETAPDGQSQTAIVNENENVFRQKEAIHPVLDEYTKRVQPIGNTLDVQVATRHDGTSEPTSALSALKDTEESIEPSESLDAEIAFSEIDDAQTETKSAFSDFEKFLESNKKKQFGTTRRDKQD